MLRLGTTGARNPRSKGSSRPLFNARAETVHRLPSFRRAFRERRGLIPANGFYEWRKDESGNRTPVWFLLNDEAAWRSPESDLQNNCKMGDHFPRHNHLRGKIIWSRPFISGCR